MHKQATTTGISAQLVQTFANILELAAYEPSTVDEANERLWAIEDAAANAFLDRQS